MTKDEQLLELARERFKRCVDADAENRREARIDLDFYLSKQWDPQLKAQRESGPNPRPALTFNKLLGPVQQVENEARRNKPAIKTTPVGGGASKDTSDVIQGIARHISYASNGDIATQTAGGYGIKCGLGFFGFLTRYVDEEDVENENQEVVFRTFKDPFAVYIDPDCKEPDFSDAKYAFVVDRLPQKEYEARYPDSLAEQANYWQEAESPAPGWFGEDVQVVEYWHVDAETIKGKKRNGTRRTVFQHILNGVEVLDVAKWAGKYIPIIPVYGPEITKDGKTERTSLIRPARDPQRLHNYYKSVEAETISLAPRPKWKGAVGQFGTDIASFKNPNSLVVQYDAITTNGAVVAPPAWEVFEPPVQALSLGALQAADDVKAATNVYDASLGARSNETSGTAINARKIESDAANSHFLDNLNHAITFAGKQLIDLIPKIYDTDREVLILGEDETEKVVRVNAPHIDPKTGKPTSYMLSEGKYTVIARPGPSYGTRREEAFDLMSDLAKAYPMLLQIAGDLIFRNSDIPGADALADRLKKTLPPNLQDDDENTQIPPQIMAKLQQMGQLNDQLTQTVHALAGKLEAKSAEGATRERVALINARAGIVEAMIRAQSTEAIEAFRQEVQQVDRQLAMIPDPAMEPSEEGEPKAA